MLLTALSLFAMSGFAQINIWKGSKLVYSASEERVDSVTFGERANVEELTFEMSVTNITAVSASINIVPSDEGKYFIWLCQPTSAYEGMNGQQIAESYVNNFKTMLDQYMGLYQGVQDYPEYELLPETEYFLVAFGYDQGITSQVYEQRFTTPAGTDPETLECEITFPEIQPERVSFEVKPNDKTIYYFCGAFVKEDYNEEEARKLAQATIDETYQSQVEYNPNYPIEQVVENICYNGDATGSLAPLTGGTDYTFFIVPVTSKGKAAQKVITKDFRTADKQYSKAEISSEYLGTFDFLELKAAGHFTTSNFDETTNVMVFRLNANEYVEHVKYKLWYGATEETDSDLISWIEPYWDGERTKEQLTTDFLVFITNKYDNSVTFITLAYDENDIASKLGRTYVEGVSKGSTSSVAEFEELLKLLPETSNSKAPRLVIPTKK